MSNTNNNGWPISWEDVKNRLEALEAGGGSGGSGIGAGFINYTGEIEVDGNYIKFKDLPVDGGLMPGDEIEIGLCYGYSDCTSIVGSYKLNFIIFDNSSGQYCPIDSIKPDSANDKTYGFRLNRHYGCWALWYEANQVTIGDGNDDYQVAFVRIYKANA